jgi:hypothetical protein
MISLKSFIAAIHDAVVQGDSLIDKCIGLLRQFYASILACDPEMFDVFKLSFGSPVAQTASGE